LIVVSLRELLLLSFHGQPLTTTGDEHGMLDQFDQFTKTTSSSEQDEHVACGYALADGANNKVMQRPQLHDSNGTRRPWSWD
jgi:hypothetical protein